MAFEGLTRNGCLGWIFIALFIVVFWAAVIYLLKGL